MRYGLLLLLIGIVSPVFAAKYYKWVDEDGVMHYSEWPRLGAEELKLPASVYATPSSLPAKSLLEEVKPAQAGTYQTFSITQPEDKETVRTDDGIVIVKADLQPALQPGHKIRYYLDERRVGEDLTSAYFSIRGVDRGPHSLRAELLDEKGNELAKTAPVIFFLRKTARFVE